MLPFASWYRNLIEVPPVLVGTGKSVLLRAIIDLFKDRPQGTLAVTASTGIAAVNIGGCTLHSWAGIGLGDKPEKKLANQIAFGTSDTMRQTRRRWNHVKTLIIDESEYCYHVVPNHSMLIMDIP